MCKYSIKLCSVKVLCNLLACSNKFSETSHVFIEYLPVKNKKGELTSILRCSIKQIQLRIGIEFWWVISSRNNHRFFCDLFRCHGTRDCSIQGFGMISKICQRISMTSVIRFRNTPAAQNFSWKLRNISKSMRIN